MTPPIKLHSNEKASRMTMVQPTSLHNNKYNQQDDNGTTYNKWPQLTSFKTQNIMLVEYVRNT